MNENLLHRDVFNKAANLFGYQPADDKPVIALKQSVIIDDGLLAVYPAIIEEAFSATMDNYRKFVALKNFMCNEENERIAEHNKIVRKYRKKTKEGRYINNLTEVQLEFSKAFIESKHRKALSPTEYNNQVDQVCQQYGMIIQKRKMITIKPPAELVFQNMLVLYNQQLMIKNKRYINHGIIERTPLEPFKINSWKVTKLQRNGITSLNLCPKTIRNHRQRFEEFGVLQDYHFAGRNRAVETRINPEILVVKDIYNSKIARAENQRVKVERGKIVPNDNVKLTGTSINELKRNEKVENYSRDKEFPAVMPFNLIFTGTQASSTQIQTTAGAKNVNFCDTLLENLLPDRDLAEKLTRCEFSNYYPVDIRILYDLAAKAAITREEFYDIAMQDFFKTLQKNIYRQGNVYPGCWNIAINLFRKQRWLTFNEELYHPLHIVDEMVKLRWRVSWARKWFTKNNNVTPLFPHQYLDVTRKTSKEIGFEYTKIKWNEHDAARKNYDLRIQRQQKDAVRRKLTINHNKKFQTKLNSFFKHRITLTQLYDYVENNLPAEFTARLPDLIETKFLLLTEKTAQNIDMVQYDLNEFTDADI